MIHTHTPTNLVDLDDVKSGDTIQASGLFKTTTPLPLPMKAGVTLQGPATFDGYYPSFDDMTGCRFVNLTLKNSGPFQAEGDATNLVIFRCRLVNLNDDNDHFIKLTYQNHDWLINQCTISNCGNGVYSIYDPDTGRAANHIRVLHTTFKDIGTAAHPHQDAHCVGIQGGEDHEIHACTMSNSGSAIEFYGRYNQPMKNIVIRYNKISRVKKMSNTDGHGIVISGSYNDSEPPEGYRSGIEIHYNIIDGVDGNGIRARSMRDHLKCTKNRITDYGRHGEYTEPIDVWNPFGETDWTGIGKTNKANGVLWQHGN